MARCLVCGRRLVRPSPTGLGPVCARRRSATARKPVAIRPADARSEPIPGQTELPLTDHQPTLWSL
jgi:hypothetical protein